MMCKQGDIGANTFSKNKAAKDHSIIFRTESQGAVKSDNKGLPESDTAVHVDNNADSSGVDTDTSDSSGDSTSSDSSSSSSDNMDGA